MDDDRPRRKRKARSSGSGDGGQGPWPLPPGYGPPPGGAPPPGYGPPPPGYGPPPPGYPPNYYGPPPPPYGYPYAQYPAQPVWGLVAGVMLLIGAVIAFMEVAYMAFFLSIGMGFWDGDNPFIVMAVVCTTVALLAGTIGVVGAVSAMNRKRWALALVASILLIPGYSLIFGILALVFLVVGKHEFTS